MCRKNTTKSYRRYDVQEVSVVICALWRGRREVCTSLVLPPDELFRLPGTHRLDHPARADLPVYSARTGNPKTVRGSLFRQLVVAVFPLHGNERPSLVVRYRARFVDDVAMRSHGISGMII